MKTLFDKASNRSSKMVTKMYSTSFSLGILFLDKSLRKHIYAIYGFVRFADEIVDSFHDYEQEQLLADFRNQTFEAIENGISLNPIINSFQHTVREFDIDHALIDTFLKSMEMDLNPVRNFSKQSYDEYILGSAEVVGLMCLKVFCFGDREKYEQLSPEAMKLGSAFQKINFLRDLKADYFELGRMYFPGLEMDGFNDQTKKMIEMDIEKDFREGYQGILKLPKNSRFGVYIAYVYYYALFRKIKSSPAKVVMNDRVRIPDRNKYGLLLSSYLRHSFNLL